MSYEENGGVNMSMPVMPAYGGFGGGFGGLGGFGDGGWWIILLLLCLGNGAWGGFGGGMWPMMMGGGMELYPWLNNSEHISDGFRDQQLSSAVQGLQSSMTSGFGDVQTSLCSGFSGVNATVNSVGNSLSQQLNANQMAALERSFAAQTANTAGMSALQSQLAQCCCDNRLATAQTQALVQSENCADRAALADGIRDILAATKDQTQTILDKMCQDKIDAKNDEIAQLRAQVSALNLQASQTAQTAAIRAGQVAEVDALYNRLSSCPVPTYNVPNPNCCYGSCGNGVIG